jgi:outer membrane protein OmpA-like peptidoglycan-associated protein
MPNVRSLVTPAPEVLPPAPVANTPAARPAEPAQPAAAPQPDQPGQPAAQPGPAAPREVRQPGRGAPRVASPARQPFASDADMAKAPEMAEKMKLPTTDLEVFFAFDSADLTPQGTELLDMLGEAMADQRLADQKFVIAGHTDAKGRADYNLALSQRRAEAVRQYVIDKHGIDPANLIARGFGRSRLKNPRMPFADENRRVQIINWTSMVEPPTAARTPPPPRR